ncbi:nose resistant to fluoxetine protein 6-like protein [Leptotrombidium deliense]|uniref:Nose resistant to fluoxetine protein 6-like protein n=1 Tax=Leptotrombidium deliense TaxID=299467 RepID=A0A443SIJ2_9ACAR|nr:nose resistant to fluoxetine protein 6-like protein [Leptotrombidium deliense]
MLYKLLCLTFLSGIVCNNVNIAKNVSDEHENDDYDDESDVFYSPEADSLAKMEKFILSGVEKLLKTSMPLITRSGLETNVSAECAKSFIILLRDLRENKQWAFRMFDSSGKPPSGILQGTLTDLGSFDECLELTSDIENHEDAFRGQYCLMDLRANFKTQIKLNSTPPPTIKADGIIWDPSLRLFWSRNDLLSFRYGLCVPSTCSQQDLMDVANYCERQPNPAGMVVDINYCQKSSPINIDKTQITVLALFAVVIFFITLGTLTDIYVIYQKNEKLNLDEKSVTNFLLGFSLRRNNAQFLSSAKKLDGSPLQHLNGVRCFSLLWIILGHTYFYTDFVHYHHYRRLKHIQNIDDDLAFVPIANFTLSVNTFFFISGLLLVYSNWKKLTLSEGKINLVQFYFHRLWRIWPPYLTIIGIVFILPLLGSGPLWPQSVENTAQVCRNNFWENILFVNNFQKPNKLCLLHTWFLAVTMQFYVISAFILYLLYRYPKVCITLLISLTILSGVAVYLYALVNELRIPTVIADDVFIDKKNVVLTLYIMPYNHFGSYLSGILCGYFLVKHKKATIRKHVQTFAWFASVFVMLFVIFAPYKAFAGELPSLQRSAFYLATHRVLWSFAIGWLIFACATNRASVINRFLSWKAFGPLSSLTFLAYLVHPLLMVLHTGNRRERVYFGHYELVNTFLARTVMSFGLAYVLFVFIELPFASLEKYIFAGHRTRKLTVNKANSIQPVVTCTVSNQIKLHV